MPPSKSKVPHKPVAIHQVPERRGGTRQRSKAGDVFHAAWRPAMAWLYFFLCFFDFFLAPVVWNATQVTKGLPLTQWQPITLAGAGMMHISFAAIVGVTAWTRGKEKASPWAAMPQISPMSVNDGQNYIDPERRFN